MSKYKWTTLEHNGVLFPSEYIYHNISLLYDGKEIKLSKLVEEYILIYSKYLSTEYVQINRFNKNFWHDIKQLIKTTINEKPEMNVIQDLSLCDFSYFIEHLDRTKQMNNEIKITKADEIKQKKEELINTYGYAIVDGKKEKVGNYMIEPTGIFMGRGEHPLMGKIKRRIYPEDITLNISKDSKIPIIQDELKNHKWGEIIHDRSVEWLASWKDDITGKTKYVWLNSHSEMKGKNDAHKFDMAKKLKRRIKEIRQANHDNMMSDDIYKKQVSTALYFIDRLALRVGNEKGEDTSDTVGVSNLRVEHIELLNGTEIKLDFLGKDSVRYANKIAVDSHVYKNLYDFIQNKTKNDMIFDKITSNDINKYLQTFMKDLTAKVFRTYNATYVFKHELDKLTQKYKEYKGEDKQKILIDGFNQANIKVAKLCNHQKNVSKNNTTDKSIEKMKENVKKLKKLNKSRKKEILKQRIEDLKRKIHNKSEMKNVSLGTSKINYIDPRVIFEYAKTNDIPIDKLLNKNLIEKFKWANI